MSGSSPKDYGTELATGVIEVASQFINQKIVEAIRKNFTHDGKKQRGNLYMGQSRALFQENFQKIDPEDKQHIFRMFTLLDQIAWAWHLLKRDVTVSKKHGKRWKIPRPLKYKDFSKVWTISVSPN